MLAHVASKGEAYSRVTPIGRATVRAHVGGEEILQQSRFSQAGLFPHRQTTPQLVDEVQQEHHFVLPHGRFFGSHRRQHRHAPAVGRQIHAVPPSFSIHTRGLDSADRAADRVTHATGRSDAWDTGVATQDRGVAPSSHGR